MSIIRSIVVIASLWLVACNANVTRPPEQITGAWLRIEREAAIAGHVVYVLCDTRSGTMLYMTLGQSPTITIAGKCQ